MPRLVHNIHMEYSDKHLNCIGLSDPDFSNYYAGCRPLRFHSSVDSLGVPVGSSKLCLVLRCARTDDVIPWDYLRVIKSR